MTGKVLILVVDDEVDACQFVASLLESAGYTVACCTGGREALRYVVRNKPDLLISDVRMPEMDGLQLAAEVKRLEPNVRVILYSACGDWPMLCEALGKGCDDLLPKPCPNEEILRTVGRVLERAVV